MKKILHVVSSPRGDESISKQLGNYITEQLQETFTGSSVATLDVNVNPFPHLSDEQIVAMRTQNEAQTATQKELAKRSDEAIGQLLDSDIIVISLPLYNFGIPSTLKRWLDHIMRAGHTFSYGADGPKGLVTDKKAYIAFASGNIYSEGPYQAYDFAVPYLKTALGFIGITDVTVVRAEGTGISALAETALERAIESIAV